MRKSLLFLLIIIVFSNKLSAQQFAGLSMQNYASIQQMPYNPAFIAHESGVEINLFSLSALAGTNSYYFTKNYVLNGLSGKAVEGTDYVKNLSIGEKHFWGNMDLLGPAVSFHLKNDWYIGFYTRMRELANGGLSNDAFKAIGTITDFTYGQNIDISNSGFTTHTFGEIGLTGGKTIHIDAANTVSGGITIKYLVGIAAGTIYTKSSQLKMNSADSINKLQGDLSVLYSDNINPYKDHDVLNDPGSWFNKGGNTSLGLDLGVKYEFHPNAADGKPYLFSAAVSVTDIGSISYPADSGSAYYQLQLKNNSGSQLNEQSNESTDTYLGRLNNDSLILRTQNKNKFSVGLPTAFRMNLDWNAYAHLFLQANMLLNMRGQSDDVYRSAYANQLIITPRYDVKTAMIGVPFSFIGNHPLSVGMVARVGPFFIGSGSLLSFLFNKQVSSLDGYLGLAFKIKGKAAATNKED